MSEKQAMSDMELDGVVGGASQNFMIAQDVVRGKYGKGDAIKKNLEKAGYDYWAIQDLANGISAGLCPVAQDVLNGKYGTGADISRNLRIAGYNVDLVQSLAENMI